MIADSSVVALSAVKASCFASGDLGTTARWTASGKVNTAKLL